MRVAAIVIVALAACAGAGDGGPFPNPHAQTPNTVVFDQALTSTAAAALVEQLAAHPGARLFLSSVGGDENAALDVAEYVERNAVSVEITGICASACANSVLVASPHLTFGPGAVVAYHHSAVSIEGNYRQLGKPAPPEITRGAERLRALYARRGVDPNLLECSAAKIGLTQEAVEVRLPGEVTPRRGWRTLRQWWVPHAETLRRFGVSWRAGQPRRGASESAAALRSTARMMAYGAPSDCRDDGAT